LKGRITVAANGTAGTGSAAVVFDTTAGTTNVTLTQWNNLQRFVSTVPGRIYQLPAATTLPTTGGITILPIGDPITLKPNAADGINGGPVNTTITIAGDVAAAAVSTTGVAGTTAVYTSAGATQIYPFAWAEGVNLSAAPRYIGRPQYARTILKITCNVQTAAGNVGKVNVFAVANGTSPASGGTQLDSATGCDVNAASNTAQDMGVTSVTIPNDATLWARFTSTGLLGNGGLTILVR
jgi:hypothetical protein